MHHSQVMSSRSPRRRGPLRAAQLCLGRRSQTVGSRRCDIDSHSVRALLASRALLVKIKRDLENHVRGLLKNLGLVIGRAKFNVYPDMRRVSSVQCCTVCLLPEPTVS
jgi:hypothetical protein